MHHRRVGGDHLQLLAGHVLSLPCQVPERDNQEPRPLSDCTIDHWDRHPQSARLSFRLSCRGRFSTPWKRWPGASFHVERPMCHCPLERNASRWCLPISLRRPALADPSDPLSVRGLTVERSFSGCPRQPGGGEAFVDVVFDCVEGG